jgi:hypothetical protein
LSSPHFLAHQIIILFYSPIAEMMARIKSTHLHSTCATASAKHGSRECGGQVGGGTAAVYSTKQAAEHGRLLLWVHLII